MTKKILVTGGAGFIGSFLVDELIRQGHDVRILDNLDPQVHPNGKPPKYLNKNAEFILGDIRDKETLKNALKDVEVVFHKAAKVGVGQSMQLIREYTDVNVTGTANLLDLLVNTENKVKKVIVASSMSAYGEGAYLDEGTNKVLYPDLRDSNQLVSRDWELKSRMEKSLKPIPITEEKPLSPNSVYAISKKVQEEMVLNVCKTFNIPAVALRYFNVYGTRQSLNNPYTGVAAIFMSRIKNGKNPLLFEDGNQLRDFVSVNDVVQANILAMNNKNADYDYFNVGSGKEISINQIAQILINISKKKNLKPEITNQFRHGDIRHCFADISKIKSKLGYSPKENIEQGFKELYEWSINEDAKDRFEEANQELKNLKIIG